MLLLGLFAAPQAHAQVDDYYDREAPSPEITPAPRAPTPLPFSPFFGVRGGVTVTTLVDPNEGTLSVPLTYLTRTGGTASLVVGAALKSGLRVQIEPGLTNKRSGLEFESPSSSDTIYELVYDLEYFSLPILVSFPLALTSRPNAPAFLLGAGLHVGVLLSGRERVRVLSDPDLTYVSAATEDFLPVELGVMGNFGLMIPRPGRRADVLIAYRLHQGLSNVNGGVFVVSGPNGPVDYELFQFTQSITAGVVFNLR
ncbi:MAG: outer membrane beta-barrel protein [Catalinimonas sp.]